MPSPLRPVAVAGAGTFVTLVAFTAPLATVNETAAGLGTGADGRTWILSSMSIGLGAALLTAGRIADDVGIRRTFVGGALLLALGSLLATLSPEVVTFVLSRVVQGLGGAAIVASSLGMIVAGTAPGPARARGTNLWGASVGAGIAVGPVTSAGLAWAHSWRDVHVVLLVASLLLVVAAVRRVAEFPTQERAPLDLPGMAALGAGTSAVLAALVEGRQGGLSPLVVVLAVGGIGLLAGFVVVERRSAYPMIDLGLFGRSRFLAVTIAALGTGGGIIALLSYLPGLAGAALGIDAWGASLLLLGWSATSVVTALASRWIPESVSGRARLSGSLALVAVGIAALAGLTADDPAVRLLPGLLVAGVGSGVLNAALGREAVASVPLGQGGLGSGANNTARYLGAAVGVTVVSLVARPAGTPTPDALVAGFDRGVVVAGAITVLCAALVWWVGREPEPEPETAPARSAVD